MVPDKKGRDASGFRQLGTLLAGGLLIAGLAGACGERLPEGREVGTPKDAPLTLYAVNYPLEYFAERIGGELVRVEFPAPADVDPAYWTPGPEEVVAYQSADVILINGADYAGWVGMASLPVSRIVNTSQGFADHYIRIEGATTHSHGLEGEHSHGETAFTTWLDPTLAVMQAEAIRASLVQARPGDETRFEAGFDSLKQDLMAIDERAESALAIVADEPLLGSHPVYQYFARRYGLNLRSVHFEPHELPDESAWAELRDLRVEHPARWMLWEGEPLTPVVARLEELGVRSVVFEPCANAPQEGDYLSVMMENIRRLEDAFAPR